MQSLLQLFDTVINLYIWALIISVVLSWLVAFNVVNTSNRFVYMVGDFLSKITEPALGRIRRLYFGAYDPKSGGVEHGPRIFEQPTCHHRPEVFGGLAERVCARLLSGFFEERRGNGGAASGVVG